MTILIVGANGQLGRALMKLGIELNFPVTGLDLPELDIADPAGLAKQFAQIGPSFVVNAAAFTDVDGAESQSETAFAVNAAGAGNLANCCVTASAGASHRIFSGSSAPVARRFEPPRSDRFLSYPCHWIAAQNSSDR